MWAEWNTDVYVVGSVIVAVLVAAVAINASRQTTSRSLRVSTAWNYNRLKALVAGQPLPAMIVDLDIFDENLANFASRARHAGKTVRIATKSLRVPELIQRCLQLHPDVFQGLMCFSVQEARYLAMELDWDDFLVAYPTVQLPDLEALWTVVQQKHKNVCVMIDCVEQINILSQYWHDMCNTLSQRARTQARPLSVCIDVDMSYRPFGDWLHLGAHRSPCRSLNDFEEIVDVLQKSNVLRLFGVMGYEAQVAGLMDKNPFTRLLNPVARLIKRFSMRELKARRLAMKQLLDYKGVRLELFNGGGSGNFDEACADPSLTEVTAGSGILQSQIFDWCESNFNLPAFVFGLQVTRACEPGHIVCCQSGGFIASGEVSLDKTPQPFLPEDMATFSAEGFGEVQTPVRSQQLRIGDPAFFRPAKAGEIAERFNHYLLTQSGQQSIVGVAKTYRGLGQAFY